MLFPLAIQYNFTISVTTLINFDEKQYFSFSVVYRMQLISGKLDANNTSDRNDSKTLWQFHF